MPLFFHGGNSISRLEEDFRQSPVWAVELYTGTLEEEISQAFARTGREIVLTRSLMKPEAEIRRLTGRFMTDDVLFGYVSNVRLSEYFNEAKVRATDIPHRHSPLIIIGTGAAAVAPKDAPVIYADMARWELQQRFRRHEVKALGVDNHLDPPSLHSPMCCLVLPTPGEALGYLGMGTLEDNILFALKKKPTRGEYSLVLDLVDSDPKGSVVKVMVNGHARKFSIQGCSERTLTGDLTQARGQHAEDDCEGRLVAGGDKCRECQCD